MKTVKNNGKIKIKQIQDVGLSTEDRLRIFANLIIDRILEDKAKGILPNLVNNKGT